MNAWKNLSKVTNRMAFPIENKLVIAVASSALFDLTESDAIFKSQGLVDDKN